MKNEAKLRVQVRSQMKFGNEGVLSVFIRAIRGPSFPSSSLRAGALWCSFLIVLLACAAANATRPTAAFTADETTGLGALTVWFTDTSVPGTSDITAWEWDFGDGSTDDPLATIQDSVRCCGYFRRDVDSSHFVDILPIMIVRRLRLG